MTDPVPPTPDASEVPSEAVARQRISCLGLLTTQDLQEILGVTDDSITRAVQRGQLPPPLDLGNRHVWALEVLRAYFVRRQEAAITKAEGEQAQQDTKVQALYGGHHRGRHS